MWRSSLWSISWLRHQMFYPYVTISAAQARESDDLRHVMSPFSLFLSSFSGAQRILGYVRPRRIVEVHPPETGSRRSIWRSPRIGTAFARRCHVIVLQMLLRRMQTLNWDTATEGVRKEPDFFVPVTFCLTFSCERPCLQFWSRSSSNIFQQLTSVWKSSKSVKVFSLSGEDVFKRQQIQLLWTQWYVIKCSLSHVWLQAEPLYCLKCYVVTFYKGFAGFKYLIRL